MFIICINPIWRGENTNVAVLQLFKTVTCVVQLTVQYSQCLEHWMLVD